VGWADLATFFLFAALLIVAPFLPGRAADRLVIFPDTVDDDPDGVCRCRFDAIDADGGVIASVDLQTGTYSDD
jgi:hypothetical protein